MEVIIVGFSLLFIFSFWELTKTSVLRSLNLLFLIGTSLFFDKEVNPEDIVIFAFLFSLILIWTIFISFCDSSEEDLGEA